MRDFSLRRTLTEKDKSESEDELLKGSAEGRMEVDACVVLEDVLLKLERLAWDLGWTAGSRSMQTGLNVKLPPTVAILHSSSAQSRLSPKTKVSSDMEVRTGKNVSAATRRR